MTKSKVDPVIYSRMKKVCDHLGLDVDKVLSYGEGQDQIRIVVDNGIKGCPKYTVPLSIITEDEVEVDVKSNKPKRPTAAKVKSKV